jgi:hypothetical protein
MNKETPMRRIVHALSVLLLVLAASPLFATARTSDRNIVDDVIRMQRANVDEDAIIQFIQKSDARFDVSADDLIALSDAKVSRSVMKVLLDESDNRNGRVAQRDTRTRVVVAPSAYWDPWYYDPFWYSPRVSIGFGFGGFGFGGYRGGFYRGGGHFGGGHGGGHGRH